MAFPSIAHAVAKVVMDAKLKVLEDFKEFLGSKIEMDDDLNGFFKEYQSSLQESEEMNVKASGKKGKGKAAVTGETKKKRAASIFNIYVKDIMPKLKETHGDVKDGKKLIGFASESWKSDPFALFVKEKAKELKSDSEDNVELYAKIKAMYSSSDEEAPTMAKEEEPETDKPLTKKTKAAKTKAKATKTKAAKTKAVDSSSDEDAPTMAEEETPETDKPLTKKIKAAIAKAKANPVMPSEPPTDCESDEE